MMENRPLLFDDYYITFQEVPNEVTLVFTVSGCPYRCRGCHSPFLQSYVGKPLKKYYERIVETYKDYATCVCFMGGDQNSEELTDIINDIKDKYNLKIALYSGSDKFRISLMSRCDYIKSGQYIESLGGLNNPNTNQRFYVQEDGRFRNKTYLFWKDHVDTTN